jgi:hypothetical protein
MAPLAASNPAPLMTALPTTVERMQGDAKRYETKLLMELDNAGTSTLEFQNQLYPTRNYARSKSNLLDN